MPTYKGGRHEHGQNYLTDSATITKFVQLVTECEGSIVEIGPGRGALTRELEQLHRTLTVIEIDPSLATRLRDTVGPHTRVVNADFLQWPLPTHAHVVVGNVPFHLTTAILRKLLHTPTWTQAALLVQWEVARRRAAVGGATMMTAQWWPWVQFSLRGRIPRTAFTPAPNVDGGLLVMNRRDEVLLDPSDRDAYRQFVHGVFTGKGRGLAAILANMTKTRNHNLVRRWTNRAVADPSALPKDLSAQQWVSLFNDTRDQPPRAPKRAQRNPRSSKRSDRRRR